MFLTIALTDILFCIIVVGLSTNKRKGTNMSEKTAEEKLVDIVVGGLKKNPTASEFRLFASVLGGYFARDDKRTLSKLSDYVHGVRHNYRPVPESQIYCLADGLSALLDGYFATLEPIERMENLVREVGEHPLWRAILRVLDMDKSGRWSHEALSEAIRIHEPEVTSLESAIVDALPDMQVRKLVESFPSFLNQNERVYSLGRLGCELHAKITNG